MKAQSLQNLTPVETIGAPWAELDKGLRGRVLFAGKPPLRTQHGGSPGLSDRLLPL